MTVHTRDNQDDLIEKLKIYKGMLEHQETPNKEAVNLSKLVALRVEPR